MDLHIDCQGGFSLLSNQFFWSVPLLRPHDTIVSHFERPKRQTSGKLNAIRAVQLWHKQSDPANNGPFVRHISIPERSPPRFWFAVLPNSAIESTLFSRQAIGHKHPGSLPQSVPSAPASDVSRVWPSAQQDPRGDFPGFRPHCHHEKGWKKGSHSLSSESLGVFHESGKVRIQHA